MARARAVIGAADDGAESPGESLTRLVVLRAGLPAPTTQIRVVTSRGTFWGDLGWPGWRLLLEYDGVAKYGAGPEALVEEKRREDAVRAEGWSVLRVMREDIQRPATLLGRIRAGDTLSRDGEHWQSLAELPELVPEAMRHAGSSGAGERLTLARLREDERRHDRRAAHPAPMAPDRRRGDRRNIESFDVTAVPVRRGSADEAAERNLLLPAAVALTVIFSLAMYLFWYRPAVPVAVRNCEAQAAPAVDWNGCNLTGRALGRADLREANLGGAILARADLHAANLTRADLRQAHLEAAGLHGATLRAVEAIRESAPGAIENPQLAAAIDERVAMLLA